jgi:hypothetical protein
VKDCTVRANDRGGIEAADGVQVEGCLVGGEDFGISLGNGSFGISGGARMLVTRNTVSLDEGAGIVVGANSTVTHNTVSENGIAGTGDGITVGPGSLVTRNTSNDNAGDGIQAVCPATITHNTALDNDGLPINPPTSGNGCVLLHNTTSDGGSCTASALADC